MIAHWTEAIFKEIRVENVPELTFKFTDPSCQINPSNQIHEILTYNIMKLQKIKYKEKILKAAREKRLVSIKKQMDS